MAKSAATATSAEEHLSCWRGPLEERLRKAVGRALAEQPKDPCTAVALELLRGTGLGEGAAALSAQQEDGSQDDLAGRPSGAAEPPPPLPPPLPPPRPTRSVAHAPLLSASAAPPIPPLSPARAPVPTHGRTLRVQDTLTRTSRWSCASSRTRSSRSRSSSITSARRAPPPLRATGRPTHSPHRRLRHRHRPHHTAAASAVLPLLRRRRATLPAALPPPSLHSSQVDAELTAEWGVAGWVNSLALTEVVAEALKEPAGTDPFMYVLSLSLADLESKLIARGGEAEWTRCAPLVRH